MFSVVVLWFLPDPLVPLHHPQRPPGLRRHRESPLTSSQCLSHTSQHTTTTLRKVFSSHLRSYRRTILKHHIDRFQSRIIPFIALNSEIHLHFLGVTKKYLGPGNI